MIRLSVCILWMNHCAYPKLQWLIILFSPPHAYSTNFNRLFKAILPSLYIDHKDGEDLEDLALQDYKELQIQNTISNTETFLDTITPMCLDNKLDFSQIKNIQNVSFWLEDIFQLTIGVVGIVSNLTAIPSLCSTRMKSVFNKLLLCLLIVHTVYIIAVLSIQLMWPAWVDDSYDKSNAWFIILFSFVLYPFEQIMLYSSTFITTLMARQRYIAIRHPIEYRNSILAQNPWIPAIKSLVLVLLAAALFTLPLYFETSVTYKDFGRIYGLNATHFQYVST